MKRKFDDILQTLKQHVLEMGTLVQEAVEKSTDGLIKDTSEILHEVFEIEKKINAKEIEIDEACVLALARNAPVAGNLRLVVAIIKINNDLERMGDLAKSIAHNAEEYLSEGKDRHQLAEIPQMTLEVKGMIELALQALVHESKVMAEEVLAKDDSIDRLKDSAVESIAKFIEENPKFTQRAMKLIAIAKNLERLGDHATNIAEDVIYISTGLDIRHGQGIKK